MLDFSTFNFSKCDISSKRNFFKCRTKIVHSLDIFGLELLNLKSASSNLLTCKVSSKNKKTLNLHPKIPYYVFLGCNLIKLLQIFNQHPRISENIKFDPKQKKLIKNFSWDQKLSIWIFGLEF